MLIRPTGLTLVEIIILLNCAHGSEANINKGLLALKQKNTKLILSAIMKEVYGVANLSCFTDIASQFL